MKNAIPAAAVAMAPDSFPDRVLLHHRQRIFDAFMGFIAAAPAADTILDVGIADWHVTEHRLPAMMRPEQLAAVTCCDIPLPGPKGGQLEKAPLHDSRNLPFGDCSFDWVFCNGVLEYIGSFERQYELLKEMTRVARRGVFVTAANRWHPIEFNTALPLLHWLPSHWWRRSLKLAGKRGWASEAALNLLDADNLKKLVNLLPGRPKADIGHIRYFGLKAHFFLQIEKPPVPCRAGSREAA